MIQGSNEWFAARLGKVTASRVADVIAKTKSGWGAGRANYMAELLCERLTGQPAEKFTNGAMQWGTATEPDARAAYVWLTEWEVAEVGFVPHPFIPMSGASPDGLVSDLGLIEIKCPNTATHLETLLGGSVPSKYITQTQWQMGCTEREWCDFVSFDPRLPDNMRFFCRRIVRDDKLINELETLVSEFLAELDDKHAALIAKYGEAP